MVIELSGIQFGLKSYAWFQNWMSAQREFELNHKYDFRPKLHDTKFDYHFITSILPAIWFVTLNKIWNLFGRAVLVILFHWLGKRCDLEQKMVRFGNISHCWEPIRLHESSVISKWIK